MNPFEAVIIWFIIVAITIVFAFFGFVLCTAILVGLLKSGGWYDTKLVRWWDDTNDIMEYCGDIYFSWVNRIFNPFKWAKMLVDAKERKESVELLDDTKVVKKSRTKKLSPIDQMFEDMLEDERKK